MKFKDFLNNLFTNVKDGISRFLIAFICSALGFLTVSYNIIFESGADDIIIPLYMAYALAAVVSILLKLIQEYHTDKLNKIIQNSICAVIGIGGAILMHMNYDSLYMVMAYCGIMISLICFIFFIIMQGENRDTSFPKIVASYIFSAAMCGVVSSGLSICIAAFQSLIFTWNNIHKLYLIINLFVWIVGFPNVFISYIPKKDVPATSSKIYRIFLLFIGLPIYILLIAILLVYLAKIVITWNMPVGEINWFASFASLFFIFILMSVMQYTEKLARLFVKYGGYFLIPVLIMQAIAVFERINAYGLTTPRTISITLIVISALFILGAIVAPKHLNKIALASGVIVLVVTITPFNVIDMPIASQTRILKTTLEANNMIQNGTVVPNKKVNKKDIEKIMSAYNYLKYDAEKVPDFIPYSNRTVKDLFGFDDSDIGDEQRYIYCDFATKESVSIAGYETMEDKSFFDEPTIIIENDGKEYEIDLKAVAEELYSKYGEENRELDIYVVNDNVGLYFRNFSFDVEGETITNYYFNGYILLKNQIKQQ